MAVLARELEANVCVATVRWERARAWSSAAGASEHGGRRRGLDAAIAELRSRHRVDKDGRDILAAAMALRAPGGSEFTQALRDVARRWCVAHTARAACWRRYRSIVVVCQELDARLCDAAFRWEHIRICSPAWGGRFRGLSCR